MASAASPPIINAVTYDGATVFVSWQATIPPGFTGFLVTLFEVEGGFQLNQPAAGSTARIQVALDAKKTYKVYVTVLILDSFGPQSERVFVLAASPTLAQVTYDLTQLALRWTPVTETGAELYLVTLRSDSSLTNKDTNTTSLALPGQLDGKETWQVSVAAMTADGVSVGPSTPARTVILTAPQLTGLSYNLTTVAADWGNLVQPGAQGYVVTLTSPGHSLQNKDTTRPFVAFEEVLDPNLVWQLFVAAKSDDGIVLGPSSQTLTVILLSPAIQELDYDAAQLTTTWSKVSDQNITGYLIRVIEPGSTVSNFPVGDLDHATVGATLEADKAYQVVVLATNGPVTGPPSTSLAPLTQAPLGPQLDYNGTNLLGNWTLLTNPQVTGYLAELDKDDASIEQKPFAAPPATFASGLVAASLYKSRVRTTGDRVKGPFSLYAPGPYAANLTYEYDLLSRVKTVTWNGNKTLTYSLDDAGNILSIVHT